MKLGGASVRMDNKEAITKADVGDVSDATNILPAGIPCTSLDIDAHPAAVIHGNADLSDCRRHAGADALHLGPRLVLTAGQECRVHGYRLKLVVNGKNPRDRNKRSALCRMDDK